MSNWMHLTSSICDRLMFSYLCAVFYKKYLWFPFSITIYNPVATFTIVMTLVRQVSLVGTTDQNRFNRVRLSPRFPCDNVAILLSSSWVEVCNSSRNCFKSFLELVWAARDMSGSLLSFCPANCPYLNS